jgi:hypothetical protein
MADIFASIVTFASGSLARWGCARTGEPITASVRKAVDAFPFDLRMVREAAIIRSRDLDEGIITSDIRRFIHQRSATTSDGAMIADIALSALGDGLTHTLRHFGLD